MKYYAVIDTNVLVSTLLTKNENSPVVQVMRAVQSGKIIPLYSGEILKEYDEVLHRPKFHFANESVGKLVETILRYGITVEPSPTGEILPDMDDIIFYEVVMEKREDDAYLITGNMKHFPRRNYIVTPAQMMEILNQS